MKLDRRGLLQAMSVGAALAPVLPLNSAFASESDSSGQEASTGAEFVQMDTTFCATPGRRQTYSRSIEFA
jgi:hypothetical protein